MKNHERRLAKPEAQIHLAEPYCRNGQDAHSTSLHCCRKQRQPDITLAREKPGRMPVLRF
jgi:hypothetical protein